MKLTTSQSRVLLLCGALALITVIIYWPVRGQQFVNLDDDVYVTENTHVRNGLTWENVRWAFQTTHGKHWFPLTWLSHMTDCQLFGVDAGAHKTVNVAFHIASALLLFLVLKRTTVALWPSFFVAALFALHPLRVESVAWVAERKDVLSVFFWMLTLWAYVRYVERPGVGRYLWIALFFTLGLMAKPMIVTLPLVLLLLDFWPLGRTRWVPATRPGLTKANLRCLILEKVPLFGLAAVGSSVTLGVSRSVGAVVSTDTISMQLRITNALVSYAQYLGKIFWPHDLTVLGAFPQALPLLPVIASAFLIAGISVIAVYTAKRYPYLLMGWLWYLGTLLPVIGFVQLGGLQSVADRFTYIPSIGIFICVAWTIADMVAMRPGLREAAILGEAAAILACAATTRLQLHYWEDSVALLRRAVAITSGNFLAEANLGVALCNQGQIEEGVAHLQEALRLSPEYAYAHNQLGRIYFSEGKVDEGIDHLRKAVELEPGSAADHNNLGTALSRERRFDEAAVEFTRALELEPAYALADLNLGGALISLGRTEEAVPYLREAVRLRPDNGDAHYNLGVLLAEQGRRQEAISELQHALKLEPNRKDIRRELDGLQPAKDAGKSD